MGDRKSARAPDLLDRRQREAACLLLSAIDLPATACDVARQWQAAARVCPGATADMLVGGRRDQLQRARALIDQLLAEIH